MRLLFYSQKVFFFVVVPFFEQFVILRNFEKREKKKKKRAEGSKTRRFLNRLVFEPFRPKKTTNVFLAAFDDDDDDLSFRSEKKHARGFERERMISSLAPSAPSSSYRRRERGGNARSIVAVVRSHHYSSSSSLTTQRRQRNFIINDDDADDINKNDGANRRRRRRRTRGRRVVVEATKEDKTSSTAEEVEEITKKWGLETGLWKIFNNKETKKNTESTAEGEGDGTQLSGSRLDIAKQLLKTYGSAYLITSISLSLVSFGVFYVLVSSGVDVAALLSIIGITATQNSEKVGTVAIAYAAHKAASPIRFPPTVALTPIVAGWMGKTGKKAEEGEGGEEEEEK